MNKVMPAKINYKYIMFRTDSLEPGGWVCMNRKTAEYLGCCRYYGPWKQWVFEQVSGLMIWSHDCLTDIADFLRQLNAQAAEAAGGEK